MEEENTDIDLVYQEKVTNFLYNQHMVCHFCSFFFASLSLTISIILYEGEKNNSFIGYLNLLMTICLQISIYTSYTIWFKWSILVNRYTKYDTLINTGIWKFLTIELILNSFAPYPFLKSLVYKETSYYYNIVIEYKINDILLMVMFLRLYIIANFLLTFTLFRTARAQRICTQFSCQADSLFAIKSLMKQRPWTILTLLLPTTTLIFGYLLRYFESPLNEISGQNYGLISTCMWNVIITMSSVGFGDIFPKSMFGRVTGVVIALWGV